VYPLVVKASKLLWVGSTKSVIFKTPAMVFDAIIYHLSALFL
jgi:hypothetical protein